MPFRIPLRSGIVAGFVDGKSGVDGKIELDQFIPYRLPFSRARLRR
jgi:hypothetical protein